MLRWKFYINLLPFFNICNYIEYQLFNTIGQNLQYANKFLSLIITPNDLAIKNPTNKPGLKLPDIQL